MPGRIPGQSPQGVYFLGPEVPGMLLTEVVVFF